MVIFSPSGSSKNGIRADHSAACPTIADQALIRNWGRRFDLAHSARLTGTLSYTLTKTRDGPVLRLELEIVPVSVSTGGTPSEIFMERVVPRHKPALSEKLD
jgi:hypothetical protein